MLSRLDQFLAANVEHWTPLGNPYTRGPTFRPEVAPVVKVRALNDRWRYLGKPVEVGQVIELALDEAEGLCALGRAEFVSPDEVRAHYRNRRR